MVCDVKRARAAEACTTRVVAVLMMIDVYSVVL